MRKRSIALVLVLAMIATLMIGVLPASAAATYSMSNVSTLAPTVKGSGATQSVGTLSVTFDAGSMSAGAVGKFAYFELPSDYVWQAMTLDAVEDGTDDAFTADANVTMQLYGNNLMSLRIAAVPNPGHPGTVMIPLKFTVPSGADDGPIKMTVSASSSSIFSAGSVDVAKIGSSSVLVGSVDNPTMGSNGDWVYLTVKEASGGAMEVGQNTLKWKLPSGFTWDLAGAEATLYWNAPTGVAEAAIPGMLRNDLDDGRTLSLDNNDQNDGDWNLETGEAAELSGSYFKLKVWVTPDDTKAKTGEIKVSMGGSSTTDQSSFVIGTYGEYNSTITAVDPPTIYAGKFDQEIGEIDITETLQGSLLDGRTITLQLPSGAKWVAPPDFDSSKSTLGGISGGTVEFDSTSSDARTIRYIIDTPDGGTSDEAKLVFTDGSVITAADFSGDLKVKCSGSMGFKDELVIANVVSSVKATVSSTTDLKIGVANQTIGDVAVTEAASEIFETNSDIYEITDPGNLVDVDTTASGADYFTGYIELIAPSGVTFTGMPDVTVTEGDVDISDTSGATLASDNTVVQVEVSSTSNTASTVTFKNIKLNVDRTVVEGDLKLSVRGAAIIDDARSASDDLLFSPRRDAAQVVVGKVVTPAPTEMKNAASFTIGSTTYKVNGVDQTMDVAPYIKDGRTFMPLRYVALAIGVAEQNIIWDDAAKTATLMKGDKVVQVKIGSTTMLVNGVAVTMDVAPEITDSRTMLPLRFLANAFGCTTTWDAATNTATIS
ncbi:MAG: copper amine oxidase N-terminal domain-containing protein [Firmicutes bacterium]|nr:copper amine oxidase N-terminal domain-containing protein [Bacillota bacterium]